MKVISQCIHLSKYEVIQLYAIFVNYALKIMEKNKKLAGKGQFSFQSQRKAMPKNAQTTAQLHSSHTLLK